MYELNPAWLSAQNETTDKNWMSKLHWETTSKEKLTLSCPLLRCISIKYSFGKPKSKASTLGHSRSLFGSRLGVQGS